VSVDPSAGTDSLATDGDALTCDGMAVTASGLGEYDPSRPHPARIYDHWLGGKDNFAADRRVGDQVAELAPWVISGARGNRAFLGRAVRYLARAGVRQFVDVGSGLPSSGNVHEVAQAVDAGCRVVYVDHDPIVLVHARALLANDRRTIAVSGDARDPAGIFADPAVRAHLDLSQPVAVLFVAVLHFVVQDNEVARIMSAVRSHVAPGSYLVVSHTADLPDATGHPERAAATQAAAALYDSVAAPFVLRTAEQVTVMFDGFELVEPGVVPAQLWRPDRGRSGPPITLFAGVGHLPDPQPAPDSHPGPDHVPGRGPGWGDRPSQGASAAQRGGARS
jgi:O-methyltransferase involved in polyketide biosynthesis